MLVQWAEHHHPNPKPNTTNNPIILPHTSITLNNKPTPTYRYNMRKSVILNEMLAEIYIKVSIVIYLS